MNPVSTALVAGGMVGIGGTLAATLLLDVQSWAILLGISIGGSVLVLFTFWAVGSILIARERRRLDIADHRVTQ